MRIQRRYTKKPHGEINVTPLVDVMLVLLIIFMVTAPMISVNVPVDLPKTQGAASSEDKESIMISIDAKGQTFLKDAQMSFEQIIENLKQTDKIHEKRIFIRADKTLSYGNVMEIMGKLAGAGFSHVSLMGEGT